MCKSELNDLNFLAGLVCGPYVSKMALGKKKHHRIPIMMSAEEVEAIDAWRRKQDDIPSRPEAVRRLIEMGLAAKKP
jgi:hypothetical protein